ncbi:MAG: glycosyltransferase family 2 protein [Candidatus Parvarchaeum sp.]
MKIIYKNNNTETADEIEAPYILIRKDEQKTERMPLDNFDFNKITTEKIPAYVNFSEEMYNKTIERQSHRKLNRVYELAAGEAASLMVLYGLLKDNFTPIGIEKSLIAVPWLLPVPLLIATTIGTLRFNSNKNDNKLTYEFYDNYDKTVIFNITSQGNNVLTLKNSVESVHFWYNCLSSSGEINYKYEIDVVIEPEPYNKNRAFYDSLPEYFGKNLRLIVVPEDYKTSNNTKYKARALNFAVEDRRARALNNDNVWVYHQDEETTVGEDTLLGISEFINKADQKVKYGAGFIIYCLDWSLRPSQVQEMSRTNDDYRVLLSLNTKTNPLVGFHGSHFLIRSETEDKIGWNFMRKAIADDLIFENALRHKYPNSFNFLKGFAYEKAAATVKEQIKQRRRWVKGLGDALTNNEVSKTKKVVMSYSGIAWFGSIASVSALFISLTPTFSGFYPASLAVMGYVWIQMINNYYDGYLFHSNYIPKDKLPKKFRIPRIVANGIIGALVDAVAPWYIFKRNGKNKGFEVLDKDASIENNKIKLRK